MFDLTIFVAGALDQSVKEFAAKFARWGELLHIQFCGWA
jgi:hypothetical protein